MIKKNSLEAFTLIELLLVMAILAVMAVIVLVAINPTEQISKANDTGRISSVNQLGHQIQAYYTAKEGVYPEETTWSEDLVTASIIVTFPLGVEYVASNGVIACTTNTRPLVNATFCYSLDTSGNNYGALVFTKLEAKSQRNKCASGEYPYFVYSTGDGRGGIICASSDPQPWIPGSQLYLD